MLTLSLGEIRKIGTSGKGRVFYTFCLANVYLHEVEYTNSFFFLIPKLVSGRRTNSFDYTLHFSQIKIDTWVTDNSFLSIPLGFSFIFTAQKESPFTLFSTLFWS